MNIQSIQKKKKFEIIKFKTKPNRPNQRDTYLLLLSPPKTKQAENDYYCQESLLARNCYWSIFCIIQHCYCIYATFVFILLMSFLFFSESFLLASHSIQYYIK